MTNHLFLFGYSYTGSTLAKQLIQENWSITGTYKTPDKKEVMNQQNVEPVEYNQNIIIPDTTTHILLSIPPSTEGDNVYNTYSHQLKKLPKLKWVGYLSTTGVYGDHKGEWVTEQTPTTPVTTPAKNRVTAENQWLNSELPVHIFRLAGIYGPGRNAIEQLKKGTARRISKEGQVFSRIHVKDIAQIIKASIDNPKNGEIYNCADDQPEAQEKVVAYAASLLNMTPPPLIPYEQAELSPMGRNFYSCNRRVNNQKIKTDLKVKLEYPDYRAGLSALV